MINFIPRTCPSVPRHVIFRTCSALGLRWHCSTASDPCSASPSDDQDLCFDPNCPPNLRFYLENSTRGRLSDHPLKLLDQDER